MTKKSLSPGGPTRGCVRAYSLRVYMRIVVGHGAGVSATHWESTTCAYRQASARIPPKRGVHGIGFGGAIFPWNSLAPRIRPVVHASPPHHHPVAHKKAPRWRTTGGQC